MQWHFTHTNQHSHVIHLMGIKLIDFGQFKLIFVRGNITTKFNPSLTQHSSLGSLVHTKDENIIRIFSSQQESARSPNLLIIYFIFRQLSAISYGVCLQHYRLRQRMEGGLSI